MVHSELSVEYQWSNVHNKKLFSPLPAFCQTGLNLSHKKGNIQKQRRTVGFAVMRGDGCHNRVN